MSTDFYQQSILPYANIIVKICRAYTNTQEDFEDYYQEVCLQIWRSKDSYSEKAKWSTWIYRLSINVCLTLLKKSKHNKSHFATDYIRSNESENNQAFSSEPLNILYDAIRQLSDIDRAVILLYLEEKSYRDIAENMETTESNISTRINRIKGRLKKILNGKIN